MLFALWLWHTHHSAIAIQNIMNGAWELGYFAHERQPIFLMLNGWLAFSQYWMVDQQVSDLYSKIPSSMNFYHIYRGLLCTTDCDMWLRTQWRSILFEQYVNCCRCVHLLSCMKAMMVPWDCVLAEGCPGLSQTGLSVWAGAGASWVQFCSWFALEPFTCCTLSLINRSGL